MNKPGDVQIIPVDLFHPVTGPLFPFVINRVRKFADSHFADLFPEFQAREIASRVAAGDPNLVVGAFISRDGRLIGHAVGLVQIRYGQPILFVPQCQLDEPAGDAMSRGIQYIEDWGRARGANSFIFETKRSDSSWIRAFGFKTLRHLMWKSLNGTPATDQADLGTLAEPKEAGHPG